MTLVSQGAGGRLATLGALVALAVLLAPGAEPAEAGAQPPNIVLIVTDDQTAASFGSSTMPRATRRLAGRGTSFSEAIVATPQCCPSRANMLTGQYAHNNGVLSNRPGYALLREKRNVLPAWLQRAGYRTVHVGKFLNGYAAVRRYRPAPGWDRWQTMTATRYVGPTFSIDGELRFFEGAYLTRVINRMAARAVERFAPRRRPFYLQVDHLAPHVGQSSSERCRRGAMPDPRDEGLFAAARAPRPASFDEADVSDKPAYVGRLPRIGADEAGELDRLYGCAMASLRAVDRGVGRLIGALRRTGELKRTAIVFTSDNGYAYGEHRLATGKGLPYEEHLRVPLVVRPPASFPGRARRGRLDPATTANVDLAPTILDLAGARPCRRPRQCRRMDGRSLLELLRGRRPQWASQRAIRTSFAINYPAYRLSCRWDGLRTPAGALIHHSLLPDESNRCSPADRFEYYDLAADPLQLDSAPPPPALVERLGRLRRCSGIRGRERPRSGTPFCE